MIGIVGGGISGLALAWNLDRLGADFVVLEADARPGGVMRTEWAGDLPLDLGPQRTRMTGEVGELVRAAGLEDEIVEAPEDAPLWVYRKGRLRRVPLTPWTALTTDLLSLPGKVRILWEPFTAGLRPEETVERFFTRKFGAEAYRYMLGPYYGGLYGSDPAQMYARHGLSITLDHFGIDGSLLWAALTRGLEARESIPTISFTDGMQMLPNRLAEGLGGRFRPGSPVTALRRVEENVHPLEDGGAAGVSGGEAPDGPRWRLEIEGGESLEVDRVVLSLSAPRAAEILKELDPAAASAVGRLRYNRLAVVHMNAIERPGGAPLEGFGYQIGFGEPFETRGCTWNGAIFGREKLCASYLGGMKRPEVVDWDDDRLAETALEEFRTVTGHDAEVLNVGRTWIPAWDGTWDALDDLSLPEGIELCANWNARPGIPGRAIMARRVAERLATTPDRSAAVASGD